MSNSREVQNIENADEWIEEAINKKHIKLYDYDDFKNIQEVGSGSFGKVYRASYKNFDHYFALKTFFNLNSATINEIVKEIMHQRDVDYHNNIIRFHGITKFESENQIEQTKNYLLVLEYADGGTLRNYMEKNFNKLTWDNKYNLAYQLACAVSCLHDEGIAHRDLHSCNVLVHQGVIKLADFGLSKRIEEASKSESKLFGMLPYIDPKKLKDKKNLTKFDKKSDVYSIGVLLWEISSGVMPFYGESHDFNLMYEILQGRREKIVPDTPNDYANLYTECWNGEPDNRPSMHEVVDRIKMFVPDVEIFQPITNHISIENLDSSNSNKIGNLVSSSSNKFEDLASSSYKIENSLNGELFRMIQNFPNMSTNEIEPNSSTISTNEQINENISYGMDLSIMINGIIDFVSKEYNKGLEWNTIIQHVYNYLNNPSINTNLQEIHNWLLNNQNDPNYIFLLGYFDFLGIGTGRNLNKAFNVFLDASEKDHTLAQDFVGFCYRYGIGIAKNEKFAFKCFEKLANKNYAIGQFQVGDCYENGIGVEKKLKIAAYWYEKAVSNKHILAMYKLGLLYINGNGVDKDHQKAFDLFKKSAEKECPSGIMMLGYCYGNGIGININKQKAVELYHKAAYLGNKVAQYSLGIMYEEGDGIEKDINQAIYWYRQSAKQGHQNAQNKLQILKKHRRNSCKIM